MRGRRKGGQLRRISSFLGSNVFGARPFRIRVILLEPPEPRLLVQNIGGGIAEGPGFGEDLATGFADRERSALATLHGSAVRTPLGGHNECQ
jgi:hypothetical protein